MHFNSVAPSGAHHQTMPHHYPRQAWPHPLTFSMFFNSVPLHIDVAQIPPPSSSLWEPQSPRLSGRMTCLVFSTYFIAEELWATEHLGPQLINHNVKIGHQCVKRGRFYRFSLCFWFIFGLTKRPIKSKNILKYDRVFIKSCFFIYDAFFLFFNCCVKTDESLNFCGVICVF